MKSIVCFLRKEFFHVFPVFCYFFILFTLINQLLMFLFQKAGLTPTSVFEIFLAAALIAKVILVIDYLGYINYFKNKPLMVPIVWKTLNYWIILFIARFLIRFFPYFQFHGMPNKDKLNSFFSSLDWRFFFSVQIFYLLFLFIYVTFRELSAAIGEKKIRKLFFGK